MRDRIKYSQNFIKDNNLVNKLVKISSINKDDTVVEIGAGDGIITSVLINNVKNVIAYEIDKDYFVKLTNKFIHTPNIQLKNEDFLNSTLPDFPYKVFSNIPFNLTANIMKKIFFSKNSPSDSFLILQKEAAAKFVGKPLDTKNSLLAILIHPWFESKTVYEFEPNDFFPKPNVKIILVNIKKRTIPLIENKDDYFDFVTYIYGQYKPKLPHGVTQSELNFEEWIKIFEEYEKSIPEKIKDVKGSYARLLQQQESIEKIHRTRIDKEWKTFRKTS